MSVLKLPLRVERSDVSLIAFHLSDEHLRELEEITVSEIPHQNHGVSLDDKQRVNIAVSIRKIAQYALAK